MRTQAEHLEKVKVVRATQKPYLHEKASNHKQLQPLICSLKPPTARLLKTAHDSSTSYKESERGWYANFGNLCTGRASFPKRTSYRGPFWFSFRRGGHPCLLKAQRDVAVCNDKRTINAPTYKVLQVISLQRTVASLHYLLVD
mmetsp:Transcript_23879/g.44325  ORF Transcript_23879/g.44325 Transcript_23879/m.44325 type:complete len:143 (+) Transcript_23879:612-1040(+)